MSALHRLGCNLTVSVVNLLGETVIAEKKSQAADLALDLSQIASGTYYVRIASAKAVVTKKVIKE